ncbi:MAG: hypothetical protein QG585_594 [Patescibacteria group bacterium]|jgi:hypothetical protein|nr:hypothetical protein [Patescibacteria group bacterium]
MKTTLALLAELVLSAFFSYTASAQDFTVKAQTIVRSQYVGFDDGLGLYPDPVVQGNVSLTHESGVFIDLWYSSGFNSRWATDWDDELDYTVGWSEKVWSLDLTTSLSYFDNFSVGQVPYNDVIKWGVLLDFPKKEPFCWLSVTPFMSYSLYVIPDGNTPFEGGNVFALGAKTEVVLTEKTRLTSSTSIGFDDGCFGVKEGFILKHSSSLNRTLSPKLTWHILEATGYFPLGNRDMPSQMVWGSGFSWTF